MNQREVDSCKKALKEHKRQEPVLAQKFIDRLRYLAQPDSVPVKTKFGICWDLYMHVGQMWCGVTFAAMRLDIVNPLGDYFQDGNRWIGKRGVQRRTLAAKMADYWEAL